MKEGLRGKYYASDEEVKKSDEVAQRTVNRILQGRDTCSNLKVEHCYWEKQWLCWKVRMWSTENQLYFDVWYIFLWQ